MLPILRVLAKLRWLRGTKLDPFGMSADRRLERELLARYESLLDRIAAELDDSRFELAVALARLARAGARLRPDQERGGGARARGRAGLWAAVDRAGRARVARQRA